MLRFGALFALLSVLLVSPFAAADDAFNYTMSAHARMGSAGWTRKTAAAQWEGRAGGVVEWYSGTVTIDRSGNVNGGGSGTKQSGNFLLLYGAGFWDCYNGCEAATQVWASGNKGVNWYPVVQQDPFSELLSALTVQDSKGTQYRIGGAAPGSPCAAADEVVYSTDGGSKWIKTNAQLPLDNNGGGRMLGSAVVDSNDYVYIFGGQTCDGGSSGNTITLNDMWRLQSTRANSWVQVTPSNSRSGWPEERSVHGSVVGKYYSSSSASAQDALYVMFGYRGYDGQAGGNLYRNDVWVSTNFQSRTASWTQLTNRATWTARGDSQLEVTSAGVLVIAGGVSNVEGTERRELNDVWASLDGGYTWGLCSDNAKWDDRVFPYTAIDNDGYLYIMGGRAVDPDGGVTQSNDVWVSQLSFNDIDAVASTCGLIIPPCGVGLRCMPGNDFTQGVWGVSCDACPWDPSAAVAATPATMTMTYLFVAFLIISLVLAASLGYLVYRMRATGASSPIPLPASAQRWWNDKQGSNGLSDSLNKGTTGSEGDNMYNPLTIRDQM